MTATLLDPAVTLGLSDARCRIARRHADTAMTALAVHDRGREAAWRDAYQRACAAVLPTPGAHTWAVDHDGTTVVCACGVALPSLALWHVHTIANHGNPDEKALLARGGLTLLDVHRLDPCAAATVVECAKTACANRGNGRGCWTLAHPEGCPVFELPSEAVALTFAHVGGYVAATHHVSTC